LNEEEAVGVESHQDIVRMFRKECWVEEKERKELKSNAEERRRLEERRTTR